MLKNLLTFLFVFALFSPLQAGEPERPILTVWPDGLPEGSYEFPADRVETLRNKNTDERIAIVTEPTLEVFKPDGKTPANGAAVVICPGGGYNILAYEKEGRELARWFNTLGVTAYVLKYRVPRRGNNIEEEPFRDVQRAIRLVRSRAKTDGIDPNRVGVMGFSAGGHLALTVGTRGAEKNETDPTLKPFDGRPDFLCLIYPAYLGTDLTDGDQPLDPAWKIDADTPPTFIAVTGDDKGRGKNSARLYLKLYEANVPTELHIYTRGGHGYGIRPNDRPVQTWHHRLGEWLADEGFFDVPAP